MESHSRINKLKWFGYVAATIGIVINLLIFHGFSGVGSSMQSNLYFILGGVGVWAFIAWPISLYKNATKIMLLCIIFFAVEVAVLSYHLLIAIVYIGFHKGAHVVWIVVYIIAVIVGAFLYLTIYLYRKIKENNKKLQMPQPPAEKPLVTEA